MCPARTRITCAGAPARWTAGSARPLRSGCAKRSCEPLSVSPHGRALRVTPCPPGGAAGRLGAARRRPDSFVVGLLGPREGLSAHRFVSLAVPSLRVAPAWRGARRQQRKTPCESLAPWLGTRLTACAHG